MMPSVASAWWFVVIAGLLSTAGNLCLKKASLAAPGANLLTMVFNPYFIGGLFFYGMNVLLFASALKQLEVSKAYPVLAAIGFSTLSVLAVVVFRENLSLINYLGIGVILLGIALVSL
jgi:multidrug transporter EmrE-like cation transporter